MLQDMATLTGGQVISEEIGLQARERHARPARLGQARRHHQGRDHHRRRCRRQGRDRRPDQPDQGRDREHRLRLRPREAPGAPRQAHRRRRRPQGRRGHRGRAQGEEAPHRRRRVDHQGCHRRRCRRRRRRHAAPCAGRRARGRRQRSTGDEATGARLVAQSLEGPLKQIAENAGIEGGVAVVDRAWPDGQRGPQRRHRRVRGPRQARRHRRRQGHPLGAAERSLDRRALPHHRGRHRRQAREAAAAPMGGGDMDY